MGDRREYSTSLYVVLNVCGELRAWNANLLTTFSIYMTVYEQSLGFTNTMYTEIICIPSV